MDEDAVAHYLAASARNDVDGLLASFAPEIELVSPISGHMVFRGEQDLRILLTAVYGGLQGLHWGPQIGAGTERVAIGEARVYGVRLSDAMVFELDPEGRIRRIRPHLRPWLALTLLALKLGPSIARHPALIWRALRRG